MEHDVIVVGAGVAGLACARELARGGVSVAVVDKARGVGGRCATRRFDGQPVDFGALFFHGRHPAFLALLDEVEGATPLQDWPRVVVGRGTPCQPEAFDPTERRLAFAEGATALAKHLARDLDVTLQSPVARLEAVDGGWRVPLAGGHVRTARDVVLACPVEQTRALLDGLPGAPEVDGMRSLLGMFASLPCLTLIAGYPLDGPAPDWELCYPEDSPSLMLLADETTKRPDAAARTLVLQALPRWSRRHLEESPEAWGAALLADAAAIAGGWVREPAWTHPHCWRYGRLDRGTELAQPVRFPVPGGGRLGLCGDLFAAGGGVQAAFLSGTRLARRWTDEEGS